MWRHRLEKLIGIPGKENCGGYSVYDGSARDPAMAGRFEVHAQTVSDEARKMWASSQNMVRVGAGPPRRPRTTRWVR